MKLFELFNYKKRNAKEIWDYKMLEPYPINIDLVIQQGKNEHGKLSSIMIQNKDYCFYRYCSYPDNSGGYVLRRNKKNLQELVYFGENMQLCCIYHDYLFQVDHHSKVGGQFYIVCTDIFTGDQNKYELFGKGSNWTHHVYCQDSVDEMYVENDELIIKVHRVKDNTPSFAKKNVADDDLFNIDTDYTIAVTFKLGELEANVFFPSSTNVNQNIEKVVSLYINCLKVMLNQIDKQSFLENTENEVSAFLYFITDFALYNAEKDREQSATAIKKYLINTYNIKLAEMDVFDKRVDFYSEFARGRKAKAFWYLGGDINELNANSLVRCLSAFGDVIRNPELLYDYDTGNLLITSIDDSLSFANIMINAILPSIAKYFKDIQA